MSTATIIRCLNKDGVGVAGTIRSTPTVERPLFIRKDNPIEGDRVEDRDGDIWEYRDGKWLSNLFGGALVGNPHLPSEIAPYSLPREKDDN